jgi:hypothetical protein
MVNLINDPDKSAEINDMRARLWEMMSEYEDSYSGVQNSADLVKVSQNYNAGRYLPRGK